VSRWPLILSALCLLSVGTACRRAAAPPPPPLVPQLSGDLAVAGLAAPVRVVRDTWGVPHIYAQNDGDLFFAQGFVQAQDRLFQMDLWRRSAQGRLSEVLGPNFIERDAMTRRIQYRGDIAEEWESYGHDTKAIAEAFVRGVNAWVALARERPPEEFVLAGWKPEPWSAADLLNRTEAFTASGDALDEIFRSRLIATVGLAPARLLLAEDRPLDPAPGVDPAVVPALAAEMIRRVGTPPFFLGLAAPVTEGTVRLKADTTETPSARRLDHPSLRYFVHLIAPGWNVIGATAPWRPGVAEGHNERVGWTMAPLAVDSQDIYVEKLNPANPRQVEDQGRWMDIDVRTGFIAVRGRKTPVDYTTETTRHGVIVASDLERHLAFALRWTGSEPGAAAELAAPFVDRAAAAGSAEFRAAWTQWKMPARALASVEGRGETLWSVCFIPGRRGGSGTLPVAGWSGTSEWKGWRIAGVPPAAKSTKGKAVQVLLESLRAHPDRADALLHELATASSLPDSLTRQRAVLVGALADALHERTPPASGAVVFAHPLAVTDAARRRFNVVASAPAGAGGDPLAMAFDAADWDRSTAISAPGQSGSPESAHFADLAALWSEGKTFTLVFTERAVQAHADVTLVLAPK
jgi:acyl-homoserine lactone acylase PvdQ